MKLLERAKDKADGFVRKRNGVGFVYAVLKKFGEDSGGSLAALVAYYSFFSLFPLLLVLVTLLGVVLRGNPELQARILDSGLSQFPILGTQIRENIGEISGGAMALVIGIFGAVWAGLGGIKAAQSAMDRVWDVPIKRRPPFLRVLVRSVMMLALLGGALLLATAFASLGSGPREGPLVLRALGIVASALVNLLLFTMAFKILTVEDVGVKQVLPGAATAAVAWTTLQTLGGFIITRQLGGASETYGFFAVVLGLLSWLYLGAQITLLAAEVNVVRSRGLWPRGLKEPLTDADLRALETYARVEERREDETVSVALDGEPIGRWRARAAD